MNKLNNPIRKIIIKRPKIEFNSVSISDDYNKNKLNENYMLKTDENKECVNKSLETDEVMDSILSKLYDLNINNNSQNESSLNGKIIINKGTGAGGANTNYYGKKFEEKTNNEKRLLCDGYVKKNFKEKPKKIYDYYLSKTFEDKTIIFVQQSGLKMYMKNRYNIELFRCPDEAYIIEYNTGKKVIKILEKKEQNVDGSVETKLWSGPSLKREYELVLGSDFEVYYGFSVSEFLKKKITSNENKYRILNTIFNESNITVLYGDDENYFDTFDKWFNNSL